MNIWSKGEGALSILILYYISMKASKSIEIDKDEIFHLHTIFKGVARVLLNEDKFESSIFRIAFSLRPDETSPPISL